jgi:hypothetical protein
LRAKRGGKRKNAGRKARIIFGRALGEMNQTSITHMMIEFMSPGPFFAPEPFALVPGHRRPSSRIAACLAWKWCHDKGEFDRARQEIVAGGVRKRQVLLRLRDEAEQWSANKDRNRLAPSMFGVRLSIPTWRYCEKAYKLHKRRRDLPLPLRF